MEPLRIRFERGLQGSSTAYGVKPLYGRSSYITACDRFRVYRSLTGGWRVGAIGGWSGWHGWLREAGFDNEKFLTRKQALEALSATLDSAGLRGAADPA